MVQRLFLRAVEAVRLCTHQAAYQQDLILVLRSPLPDELRAIPSGNCLISILQYPTRPPVVWGIEGIPQGNLDKYVFYSNDPDWLATVPASIPSTHRRTVVSCYSSSRYSIIRPGPGELNSLKACMRHYAQQLEPLLEPLIAKGYDRLSPDGGFFERAMARATLRVWLQSGHYEARPR